MTYGDLLDLYFSRSVSLQAYWTIYVVVIGGLLAFSSLRKQPDAITGVLVSILFACFAWKNLGAIGDVIAQRNALHAAIVAYQPPSVDATDIPRIRSAVEPTLQTQDFAGVRTFHLSCDVLVLAALWAMELRRRRAAKG